MKDQLLKLLTHLGLTATRFADEIGVQRSGISHILSGRNQPSYDFIVKITRRYPEISLDWLIMGKGSMVRPANRDDIPANRDLFSENNPVTVKDIAVKQELPDPENFDSKSGEVTNVTIAEQVIIFYADGTFKPYFPAANG